MIEIVLHCSDSLDFGYTFDANKGSDCGLSELFHWIMQH